MNNGLGRRPLPAGDTAHLERFPIRQLLPETVETVERTRWFHPRGCFALPQLYQLGGANGLT